MTSPALFWFRRDLRATDNAGLHAALTRHPRVHCVFVFDRAILDALPSRRDRRVEFIHDSVVELDRNLRELGGGLIVRHARADEAIPALARELGVSAVYANGDYEPAARARDRRVAEDLARDGIALNLAKDQVIFEKDEILTQAGRPYTVFTPYRRAWRAALTDFYLSSYPIARHAAHFAKAPAGSIPTLADLGFEATNLHELGIRGGEAAARARLEDFLARMDRYDETRDYPAVKGVSYLSVHLRFGTVSIRELARVAHAETLRKSNPGAETWLSELTWRDFYMQLLWHHPHVDGHAFRPQYEDIGWENDPAKFAAWCAGRTGYPLVDAAMRQLNQTGYMHNRLRMVVASFLTKDLLIDWRWGEKYFADHLNDFDLAANNGGWQWAASTGCDAQPWFRIFSPVAQSEKFDPAGKFIRRYLPELAGVPDRHVHAPWLAPTGGDFVPGRDYPLPIVDHARQRETALAMFKRAGAVENI